MKLGIISSSSYRITDPGEKWDLRNFTISPDTLSFSKIFHSAYATPARYVQEVFLRLLALEQDGRHAPKFIFNPLFDPGWIGITLVLAALKEMPPYDRNTIIIFTDKDGLPAGYLIPSGMSAEDARFLTLFSTVDTEVDMTLCCLLFQVEARRLVVPHLALNRGTLYNGFIYEENRGIYRWVAERAIALLQANPEQSRHSIPFTAVMPHHAGDVLFFVLAFNAMHPQVDRIAVNQAYRDIIDDNAPGLGVLPINMPLINRSDEFRKGKVTPEGVYFDTIKDNLPEDSFYCYCRPSRDYNVTTFHLIDHFAFALGKRFCAVESLLTRRKPSPGLYRPEPPTSNSIRVLLHFDGGWPLKIYPKPQQERLIDLLQAKGYAITVLAGSKSEFKNCDTVTFEGYAQFKALLQRQHLLIGMDSFPAHYAAHVLGLPTICLFASTRPANSDAPAAPNYSNLENGLSCRPCYGIAQCPLYGAPYCRNFANPETVAAEVVRMTESLRNEDVVQHTNATLPREVEERCLPGPEEILTKTKNISLRHYRLKVALALTVLPYLRYVSMLYREFIAAVRMDGFLRASLRTLHFLHKKLRRLRRTKHRYA